MRLDQLLVERELAPSRARAQQLIRDGLVTVDGAVAVKAGAKVTAGVDLAIAPDAHDYVSRAALKLAGGLDAFRVDPAGLTCIDLGSSTGGFTEVLLRRGAAKVFAVDVGRDQLHPALAARSEVISLEGTHARDLRRDIIPDPIDLVVCDVSFISIMKALPPALALTTDQAELVTLVKPQFELGREAIGKNGRVLTPLDEQVIFIERTIVPFLTELGWTTHGLQESPILGGEGTTEYLLHAKKTPA